MKIVPASAQNISIPRADAIAVTALDRFGNASPPKVLGLAVMYDSPARSLSEPPSDASPMPRTAALGELVRGWEKLRLLYNGILLLPGLGSSALWITRQHLPDPRRHRRRNSRRHRSQRRLPARPARRAVSAWIFPSWRSVGKGPVADFQGRPGRFRGSSSSFRDHSRFLAANLRVPGKSFSRLRPCHGALSALTSRHSIFPP